MDLKALRHLAQTYSIEQLNACVEELESTGACSCWQKDEPMDVMTDLLQAIEVRQALDRGEPLSEAIREFSKRVRSVLN
jgi:hypothetical protein